MNALVGWLQSLGTLLEDAADGFMLMYNEGYLDGWFAFMATLALGILIGWGLRSGIVYEHKEGDEVMFFYILAAIIGVAIDRVIVWDKNQAVKRERSYHARQIDDLKKRLENANMECYSLRKSTKEDEPRLFYTNPNFAQELEENGFAKTGIARNAGRA